MTQQQKAEAYVRAQLPELIPNCSYGGTVKGADIQLQHWLRVLEDHTVDILVSDGIAKLQLPKKEEGVYERIFFNLTTGQPATEADYQAFNEIVGI